MPKIPQFRDVVKTITRLCRYEGKNENDEVIYNNNQLPILQTFGSVKLHGTCASFCYNTLDGGWAQSKNKIITPLNDNAGFSMFVKENYNQFLNLINRVMHTYSINTENNTISIFGEWAGKKIQAGVGISKLERKFYIFDIKITPNNKEKVSYWVSSHIFDLENYDNIYHIKEFQTFSIDINFEKTDIAKKDFKKLVDKVEAECPVAKHFGVSGIGEGIVFTIYYCRNRFLFKVKGKKHSGNRKIKMQESKNVDQQLVNDVVYKITHMRLEQMVQESFDVINGGEINISGMGRYLRAVKEDIIAEDLDIITDAGLTIKNINKTLHNTARNYLLEKLEM